MTLHKAMKARVPPGEGRYILEVVRCQLCSCLKSQDEKDPKPMKPKRFGKGDHETGDGILPQLHLPKQGSEKRGRENRGRGAWVLLSP